MKTNEELKKMAMKIAQAESIIQENEDNDKVKNAMKEILQISHSINSLEDIAALDEMVQEFLKRKS